MFFVAKEPILFALLRNVLMTFHACIISLLIAWPFSYVTYKNATAINPLCTKSECKSLSLFSKTRQFEFKSSVDILRHFHFFLHKSDITTDFDGYVTIANEVSFFQVMKDKGKNRPITSDIGKPTYTFEVFVCVAIIMLKRQKFLASKDEADVFSVACNIRGTIQLRDVHAKACELFVRYCKKSISDKYCKSAETDFWGNVTKFVKKIMPKNRIVNPTKSCWAHVYMLMFLFLLLFQDRCETHLFVVLCIYMNLHASYKAFVITCSCL